MKIRQITKRLLVSYLIEYIENNIEDFLFNSVSNQEFDFEDMTDEEKNFLLNQIKKLLPEVKQKLEHLWAIKVEEERIKFKDIFTKEINRIKEQEGKYNGLSAAIILNKQQAEILLKIL